MQEFFTIYGPFVAVFLTFCILSFLYKDNPFYKFAEHIFLGISAGYMLVVEIHSTVWPNLLKPLTDRMLVGSFNWFLLWLPFILCLLMFSGLSRRWAWLTAFPITFVIGMYAGANIIGFGVSDLLLQLESSMLPLIPGDKYLEVAGTTFLDNILIIVGLVASLIFFFFSRPQEGALGVVSRVGVWFLMVSFGASFGFTVMGRISLAVGRAQELIDYSGISIFTGVIMLLFMVLWEFWESRKKMQRVEEEHDSEP